MARWGLQHVFTHVVQITTTDGSQLSLDSAKRAMSLLGYFFTFVKGARVGTALPCGYEDKQLVWQGWAGAGSSADPLRSPFTWFDYSLSGSLQELFTGFCRRWDFASDNQVLRYTSSFYVGGNEPDPVQNALTLAVAGLEVDPAIPKEMAALRTMNTSGPKAIWKLRNRFIHPRMESILTDRDVMTEGWLLATWYLELALLRWFQYEGATSSRIVRDRWAGMTDPVPWAGT